jgi:hypothetical protein
VERRPARSAMHSVAGGFKHNLHIFEPVLLSLIFQK